MSTVRLQAFIRHGYTSRLGKAQELCESRGGRPRLPSLISLIMCFCGRKATFEEEAVLAVLLRRVVKRISQTDRCQDSRTVDTAQCIGFHPSGRSKHIMLFCSVQDGIYALGKAPMRSTPSLRSFPNLAFETVLVFVRLKMALSRPFREDHLALPLSTPPSSRRPMV